MSVTLEQLREEFSWAVRNLTGHTRAVASRFAAEEGKTLTDIEWVSTQPLSNNTDDNVYAFVLAARRYIIARDFNEFDPQRALMLWKLQNGGAL